MTVVTIVLSIACFIVGGFASYLFFKHGLKNKYDGILRDAEAEAEVIKKNKLLEVKEKFLNKKADLEKEVAQRNQKIQQAENKLKQRELVLNQRQEEIQRKKMEAELWSAGYHDRLPAVDEPKPCRGEPAAVYRGGFPCIEELGEGTEDSNYCIVAAFPCGRCKTGPQASAFGFARVWIYRTGCRCGYVYLSRRILQSGDNDKPQTAEIIIAKQRSGETGSVDLRWIGKYTKFADPEKHYKG